MDYSNIKIDKDLEIVFMGTPEFAIPVLQGLIDNYKVRAVVTQPDRLGNHNQINISPVKKLALENALFFSPQIKPVAITNKSTVYIVFVIG